jgi:hypothetical protein
MGREQPGMLAQAYNPSTMEERQEDCKYQANLEWDPVSQGRKKQKMGRDMSLCPHSPPACLLNLFISRLPMQLCCQVGPSGVHKVSYQDLNTKGGEVGRNWDAEAKTD